MWVVNEMYERFCLADPIFYDQPAATADASCGLLATIDRQLPAGWTTSDNGVWLGIHPTGVELPEQGWKVHVSATLDNGRRILTTVWDHCIAHRLHFKFLDSAAAFLTQNAKYADRSGSGKFVTIYPLDDESFERTLHDLDEQLRGEAGPYILSDLRYGDGPLYVRYGGFLAQDVRTADGALVPAIRDDRGNLVPDERRPQFVVPAWVPVPEVLAASLAARDATPADPFPYDVADAVHFSNGGGVYLATCRASGAQVVIKEARPYAGLDADGVDAVTRLEQEHRSLVRLAGLDCVPAVHELRRHWEHTFLVEEHVAGPTLNEEMVQRQPLIHPDPTDAEIASYRRWALDVSDRLGAAVAAVHERGVVLGDLHPRNVLLRPDGRVCLIDLELAHDVAEPWRRGMGAPAFAAPDGASGFAVDRHALAAIRLWLFLPYTELLARDPDKADELIAAATARFGMDEAWGASIRADLVTAGDARVDGGWRRDVWPVGGLPNWTALRDSVTAAIDASATPWRTDRLFPGDPEQFASGGLGLAHGAAGVVWSLAEVGAHVDEAHLDWLERRTADASWIGPGLYDGLAGIVLALQRCGRADAAAAVAARLAVTPVDAGDHTLFSGAPGVGLLRLHLGDLAGAAELAEHSLVALADRPGVLPKAGLLHGWSGLALLLVRLAEATSGAERTRWLDAAERALAADLAGCCAADDGTVQFDEGWRMLPYLAIGSAGVGLVLDQLLAHRPESSLAVHRDGISRAASTEVVVQCGLFHGRAGLVLLLVDGLAGGGPGPGPGPGPADGRVALRRHVAELAWHAVPFEGHVAFAGDQLARLSMDLGSGAAGVLLAIAAGITERPIGLPFLRPLERR